MDRREADRVFVDEDVAVDHRVACVDETQRRRCGGGVERVREEEHDECARIDFDCIRVRERIDDRERL